MLFLDQCKSKHSIIFSYFFETLSYVGFFSFVHFAHFNFYTILNYAEWYMSLQGAISWEGGEREGWDALGWPVFGSGAGFVCEAVVKGLQCSGPRGVSHTLKPRFVLVAPLISGNCLSPASYSLCFVSSLNFSSCLVLFVVIISGLPSLSPALTICSIQNSQ